MEWSEQTCCCEICLYPILHSRGLGTGDYQQMPRLILSQFRWLNQIVDGKVTPVTVLLSLIVKNYLLFLLTSGVV